MATEKVTIPDFGDVQEITVVEVYVSEGDKVEMEDFEAAAGQVEPWISPDMYEKYWEIYRDDCPHHYAF